MTATSLPTRFPRAAWRQIADRLTDRDGPTRSELLIFLGLLTLATGLLLFQHVDKAGFYSDDWAYRSAWQFHSNGSFWTGLSYFYNSGGLRGRPTLALYLSVIEQVFGYHPRWYLAWAVVLAIVFSFSVYLTLRILRLRPIDAALVSLFLLVFPASDSTRIWAMISDAQVAMSLVVLGIGCRVKSLTLEGRSRMRWRVAALSLIVIGVTTYELTFVALLLTASLYRTRVSWRRALGEAAVDWVVLICVYALVLTRSTAVHLSGDQTVSHAWTIFKQSLTLFSTVALPFRSTTAGLIVAGAIILTAVFFVRILPQGDPVRKHLLWWLMGIAVALILLVGAYGVYAPTQTFYVPLATGESNRTNAFAAAPMLFIVYGLCVLVGTMIFRSMRAGNLATAAAAVLAGALGIGYTVTMAGDLRLWDSGWNRAHQTLIDFQAQVPKLRGAPLVIFYGEPIQEVAGIPVWAHMWDLEGALQLTYNDPHIRGRPGFPGMKLVCSAKSAQLLNTIYPTSLALPTDNAPWGSVYVYNTVTNVVQVPESRAQCTAAAAAITPGPWVAVDPGADDPPL